MIRRVQLVALCVILVLCAFSWGLNQLLVRAEQRRLELAEYEPPPPGMVFVPAGRFLMGSDDPLADPDERPRRKVFLPAFYIDQHEVTNREYKEFDREHVYPEGADDLPVSGIFKHQAKAYCFFVGKRLPTAAEWEKAARGTDGRLFPYGNTFDPTKCNVRIFGKGRMADGEVCEEDGTNAFTRLKLPVGSFPAGASPYGALDMCGNVWEWVSDVWTDRDPLGRSETVSRGIIKGGGYGYSEKQCRASYQGFESLETTCHDVGFRCVRPAIPKK